MNTGCEVARSVPARLSGRYSEVLAVFLPAQAGRLVKRLVVSERCITNASQLVGQRTGGLVVVATPLRLKRPAAHIP